jgi:hypothetical protein
MRHYAINGALYLLGILLAHGVVAANVPKARAAAQPLTLDQISHLSEAGAPHLAIKLLDQGQPPYAKKPVVWLKWERERIHIDQAAENWRAVIARVRRLPNAVPADFRTWELTQAAEAELKLGKYAAARRRVRRLIFGPDKQFSTNDLKGWRKLIIQSYVAEGGLKDAVTAVLRFRQDYHGALAELAARLFLRTQQPKAALSALKERHSAEAGMLRWLAKLRTGKADAAKVEQHALKLAHNGHNSKRLRQEAWSLAASAAKLRHAPSARVSALENALALQSATTGPPVWTVAPDALWSAYLKLGTTLVDTLKLKANDSNGLFLAASNRFDSNPRSARALFALVIFHDSDSKQRAVASDQFAASLEKLPAGAAILNQLYLHSQRFKASEAVPAAIRYRLVKYALAQSDVALAAHLVRSLKQPPPKVDAVAWQLERAHIFIRAGKPKTAVSVLTRLLAGDAKTSVEDVLPVLFDLQAVGQDRAAIRFFRHFLKTDIGAKQQRHLLYWMAESYASLGDHRRAAKLYLDSATLKDPYAMDPWAKSARYQAAKALAQAGLAADARRQYQSLLNASDDPSRQATLRHDIEQLKLKTNAAGK